MHAICEDLNSAYSPSFNRYFNADVIARVTAELAAAGDDDYAYTGDSQDHGDFEFNLSNLAPDDGDISPVYPLFNRDLLREEIESRPPISLQNLFLEDGPQSTSSSEADELEEMPPEMYCFWTPSKSSMALPGRCRKSNSTGSSATEKAKVWKLRDLLNRSRSDGKEQGRRLMMLFPPKKKEAAGAGRKTAAREVYPGGEKKRRSYLPYRQDILGGLFVSPQALPKSRVTTGRRYS